MDFVLSGYTQNQGVRRFTFERIEADRSRSAFRVDADLALMREFHVTIQELPLMCRRLLEALPDVGPERSHAITREDLCAHAARVEAAKAAHKPRIAPKRPRPEGTPLGIRPFSPLGAGRS